MSDPRVSVVIPTYNRPQLVTRAVRSALAQTIADIEVIVVIDGGTDDTRQALAEIRDPRLRIKVLAQNVGTARARRAGVNAARGRWIAHLDDDDEWMARKLELQLEAAEASAYAYPIVACRLLARTDRGEFIWPRQVPRPGQPLSEYLFCRSVPFFGQGVMPSTVLVAPRELLLMLPLPAVLGCHDDLDWVLRAVRVAGAGVEFVTTTEPLAIWHREGSRVGRWRVGWRPSVSWIQSMRPFVTRRAYASFLLHWIGAGAGRYHTWDAFGPLLWQACRHGQPAPLDLLTYFAYWLIPEGIQHSLAQRFTGTRRSLEGSEGQRPSAERGKD